MQTWHQKSYFITCLWERGMNELSTRKESEDRETGINDKIPFLPRLRLLNHHDIIKREKGSDHFQTLGPEEWQNPTKDPHA